VMIDDQSTRGRSPASTAPRSSTRRPPRAASPAT
jgi:hypothetical protein